MATRKYVKKFCIVQTLRNIEPGGSLTVPLTWNYETIRSARYNIAKEGVKLNIKRLPNGYMITRDDDTDENTAGTPATQPTAHTD